MATYRELHGRSIQAVTTDPTGDVAEGQIWYNTTSDAFKTVLVNEAWISQTPMNTGVYGSSSGGTADAYFVAGGNLSPPLGGVTNKNEQYNGSGFTEEGNLTTARMYSAGTGTVTASLVTGGDQLPSPRYSVLVEEYNGTSWSEQNDIPQNKNMAAAGPQTAALIFGGSTPSATSDTRFYDGTDWTSGPALNTARFGLRGGGNQAAAIAMAGDSSAAVEEYNGSSWTSVTSLPANRSYFSGTGPQTNALAAGGYSGSAEMNTTFKYDGTNWTSAPNLGTGRYYVNNGATGTGNNTWIAGGGGSPLATTTTEEFNSSANIITAAAFSSGGNLNTARYDIVGTGLQTAAVAAGGYSSSRVGSTENYDGSAWTNSSTKPTAVFAGAMVGTQTASFYASGNSSPGGGRTASTEEYDGSNWTSGGNVNTARQQIGAQNGGTLTAGIIFGGNGGPTATEHYDGTSWSTQPATVNDGRWNAVGTGDQTAAVMAGADNPATTNVEEYNGSAWSEVNNLPQIRYGGANIGTTQTDYILAAGQTPGSPGYLTNSLRYDGTNWSTGPSNSTARTLLGGSSKAPTSAGLIYGGYLPSASNSNATEEWNGETSSINVKTLTQS